AMIVHARGDVEQEEGDGVGRWAPAPGKLSEAQIIVGDRNGLRSLRTPALDHLLHGASAVQPRAGSASIPALADIGFLLDAGTCPRLQVWQLQLVPEPVEDVIDLEFQHE